MSSIDWIVLIVTISFIVFYGIQKTKKFNTIKDHLKGGGSANWLTVGLSVMATQASAITFLSTPDSDKYDVISLLLRCTRFSLEDTVLNNIL